MSSPLGVALIISSLFTGSALGAPPPLRVRLLAKEHPSEVSLAGRPLVCDGEALDVSAARAEVSDGGVALSLPDGGTRECIWVSAQGPSDESVRAGSDSRSYSGALELRAEGPELALYEEVKLEPYVAAVVSAEAGDLPLEAQKAQAIVSRSFALVNRGRHADAGYDLCDLTHCQLYRGEGAIVPSAEAATRATEGQRLTRNGVVLDGLFHAVCGGATSSARDIFREEGGPIGVSDVDAHGATLCKDAPGFRWQFEISASELGKIVGARGEGNTVVERRDAAGRALELTVLGVRIAGPQFLIRVQRAKGYQSLRSLKFTVERVKDTLRFSGRGSGHGVGLCQAGARELARRGANVDAILKHYFPDASVSGYGMRPK